MTDQPVKLDQLEIIGYADVLPDAKGPAVVPPVFRDRQNHGLCFVPPFRVAGNWLIDAQRVSWSELKDLARDGRVTLLADPARLAATEHQLWVDDAGRVHYEPGSEAKQHLHKILRDRLDAATAALRAGEIDEAERQAEVALAADPRKLEARALITACHALRGEERHVAFMRQAAEAAGHRPEAFEVLVKSYAELVPPMIWDDLSFERAAAACERLGIELRRRFELPADLMPFVTPVLWNASVRRVGNSCEVECGGFDAAFLGEFMRLFRHNYLSTMKPGQAVEVVRKAYWVDKDRRSRLTPPLEPSIEGYFFRLEDALVTTGVLGFVRKASAPH